MRFIEAERDENTCRKDFTPTEAVSIADALEEEEKRRARSRHAAKSAEGGKKGGKGRPKKDRGGKSLPTPKRDETKRASAAAARAVGMSRPTLEKAREIVKAAEQEPEKFGHLVEKMNATGKVAGVRSVSDCAKNAVNSPGHWFRRAINLRALFPRLDAGKT